MKKKSVNSQLTNLHTYQMYKRQMTTLAENVFQIKNLPSFIDVSYVNQTLLYQGAIAFFQDDVLGLLALPFDVLGSLDIYGRPINIMARAYNGRYFRKLSNDVDAKPEDNFVIMYDNSSKSSIYFDILQMAERIALNKRTIDINIVQQRTPRIWKTSKDKELSLKGVLQEIDSMVENVLTYDSLDLDEMECILQPSPFVADKVNINLDKEWAEFYRLIGVSNLIEQKRERLIKDEMSASQGGTIASRYSRFEPRKRAIEEINKKWGYNIEVSYYDGEPDTEKEDIEEDDIDVNADLYTS